MATIIHSIPGRLRLRAHEVTDPQLLDLLHEAVAAAGARIEQLNLRARSLVLRYDPAQLRSETLVAALADAGLLEPAHHAPARRSGGSGLVHTLGTALGSALVKAVWSKGIERAAGSVVGGLVGRR